VRDVDDKLRALALAAPESIVTVFIDPGPGPTSSCEEIDERCIEFYEAARAAIPTLLDRAERAEAAHAALIKNYSDVMDERNAAIVERNDFRKWLERAERERDAYRVMLCDVLAITKHCERAVESLKHGTTTSEDVES
jgi:hypothetical protein